MLLPTTVAKCVYLKRKANMDSLFEFSNMTSLDGLLFSGLATAFTYLSLFYFT